MTRRRELGFHAKVTRLLAPGCLVVSVLLACGDPKDPGDTEALSSDGTSPGATSTGASATAEPPDPTTAADTGPDDATTQGSGDGTGTSTGGPVTTGEPDATTADATTTLDATTSADETTGGVVLPAPELPIPTAPCPELVDGTVMFDPEGLASPRAVRIWVDLDVAAELDGPVVFYWHGTGGQPDEALSGLGELGIQEILDAGGIVVAATHDPGAGIFPWHLVLSDKPDDLLLADEVLACAQEQLGVDARRIHSLGFSAGGLHTAQMSIRRSSYLASVVTYSGGLIFGGMPPWEDPGSALAAMIFHGGPGDVVVVGFEQASKDYQSYLSASDNFSFLCNHGNGHSIPDAEDAVMQFMHEHPYGSAPSPYAAALPDDFPGYCALP